VQGQGTIALLMPDGSEAYTRMGGAIAKAEELATSDPDKCVLLQQFKNPANPAIHETTTGPEIWQDTDGKVDIFVAGVDTGGTMTSVPHYFKIRKACGANFRSVAVEPRASPVLTQTRNGEPVEPGSHKIQGIGAGFVPQVLDRFLIDTIERGSNEDAVFYARRLAREEGIISGISSGVAVAVACRLARRRENKGRTIVVVLTDSGECYLSSVLFDGLFNETGIVA